MRWNRFFLLTLLLAAPFGLLTAEVEELELLYKTPCAAFFELPPGWHLAEPNGMPEECLLCARKKGPGRVAPNANLTSEPYDGTTTDYSQCVKERHACYYARTVNDIKCREVGRVPTPAGTATLLHLDVSSILGDVSILQALLVKDGTAYTLTAGVSKEAFGQASSDFLQIIRSLNVNPDAWKMVNDEERRALEQAARPLRESWSAICQSQEVFADSLESLFHSGHFQDRFWLPFCDQIGKQYAHLGNAWQDSLLQDLRTQLLSGALIEKEPKECP